MEETREGSTAAVADGIALAPQPIEKVLAMGKGDGLDSYCKNSAIQAFVTKKVALQHLTEALQLFSLPTHGPVVVADLGCSSSANTIVTMVHMVETLRARFPVDDTSPPPEFQALFNDLPSTDFNNLFQLLSNDPRVKSFNNGPSSLFYAGVPGSVYGRLFARSSVQVFYSSYCINWLSKIPDAVTDKDSLAYNKGRAWINGSSLATANAYKEQAASDLTNFLTARAAELAPGGLLFLMMSGRSNPEPNKCFEDPFTNDVWNVYNDSWNELISEGILTEEQRRLCNMPLYFRTTDEILQSVESCGSAFQVHLSELAFTPIPLKQLFSEDFDKLTQSMVGGCKSVLSSILEANIGRKASELFWQRYTKIIARNIVPKVLADNMEFHQWNNTIVMTRK